MKRLLVIHTGGTISMSQDESNTVNTNGDNPIANHQELIQTYADIKEVMPFTVPSPHITIAMLKKLNSLLNHMSMNLTVLLLHMAQIHLKKQPFY